jgi:enamine deaminase RidA (YjgF/YER057c/UK114 family)
MGVKRLQGEDRMLMVDGILRTGDEEKNAVATVPGIPQPEGDYSEVVEKGGFVFTAGEVPTDWEGDWGRSEHRPDRSPDPRRPEGSAVAQEARTNPHMWYGEPIRNHTDYVMDRLEHIVEEIDTPVENTVKAEIYLPDPADFPGFEEVWQEWFPDDPPARVVAPYQGLGLKGARVEIVLQLVHPDADIEVERISTDDAPQPLTHEAQAIRAGDLLFISGQMAHDENGVGRPAPGPKAQMDEILQNSAAICEAAGTSLDNVVSTKCFYGDLADYDAAMEAWEAHFEEGDRPANIPMEVGEPLLVPDCDLLVDVVAHVP